MKPNIFVTRPLPGDHLERLARIADVNVHEGGDPSPAELERGIAEADGAITMLVNPMGRGMLSKGKKLKIVANYAVGYDNIDVAAATELGIWVANTPDVLTEATADMAWALLLAVSRRIAEGDRLVREGKFDGWKPDLLLGRQVYGKTLGIVGMGRIGQAAARRAAGFGMRVLYSGRRPLDPVLANELRAEYAELERLLRESDYVSLHAPFSEANRHLIGAEQLRMMKPDAILINTARGALVDERALADALKRRTIAGAGLDVFEREPLVEPLLLQCDNAVLAPHTGSATRETRGEMAGLCVDAVIAALQGEIPRTALNPQAGASGREAGRKGMNP
ncbi:2-hydroxyacid dehydrogenase [Cohnella cellulosilytica]|uniref:2-hydroxyacid dehydrogenase n=1 Tax=Cohnella cellulosilytica TaxID=986710 RepID=A0ABW2F5Q7_9BACL